MERKEGDKSSSGVRWRRRFKVSHNNQNKARQGRAGQGRARQGREVYKEEGG